MTNQELTDYIKQQSQQGKNKEEIKKELLAVGWGEQDIKEAFVMVGLVQPSASSVPLPSPDQENISASLALPDFGDLLQKTFSIYELRLGTFIGIVIFPLIVGSLAFFLFLISLNYPLGILSLIILIPVVIITGVWSQVSLIFAIKDREEKIGIVESFKRGWSKLFSFFWVSILFSVIIMGGYLLFIIPGVIFSIWFSFSLYILVSENLKGMNALFRSKQLVSGYWVEVWLRFFLIGLITSIPAIVLYAILGIIISPDVAEPIIRIISNLFITPFTFAFGFLLYENLKRMKAQIPFEEPKKGEKIKFILVGIVGLLLPVIIFSIIFISARQVRGRAQEAVVVASMSQLRAAMELYGMKNDNSYSGANCSLADFSPLCSDIERYTGGMPIIESSKDQYCFYVKLPSGEYCCFSKIFPTFAFRSTSDRNKTTIFPGGKGYCDGITFKCPEKR